MNLRMAVSGAPNRSGWWRLAAVVALLVTLVTGLGYAGMPASQASAAGHTPVTLSWQMWVGNQTDIDAWNHDAAIVHAMFPWITVKLSFDPAWPGYWVKFPVEISSDTEPDLVAIQSLRTTGFQSGFMSLTTAQLTRDGIPHFSLQDFNQGILNGLKNTSGQQIALPYDFGPLMVFYNKTIFLKYHLPLPANNWTWAQFNGDCSARIRKCLWRQLRVPVTMAATCRS